MLDASRPERKIYSLRTTGVADGKTIVFSSRRKEERDGAAVTLGGSGFDVSVPATGKARSSSERRRVARNTRQARM